MKPTKLLLILITILLALPVSGQIVNPGDDRDTDARSLFSLTAGFNSTNLTSERELFKSAESSAGYSAGLNFVHFPDYEFGNFMMRIGLTFQKEISEATEPTNIFDGNPQLSRADLSILELQFFGAYRFNPAEKFEFYLGGGIAYQNIINDADEAYTFIDEDGNSVPIFYPDDFSQVAAFRVDPPKSIIAFNAETGFFSSLTEGGNLLNFALGVQYGLFLTNPSNASTFNKSSFYVKLGYEVF